MWARQPCAFTGARQAEQVRGGSFEQREQTAGHRGCGTCWYLALHKGRDWPQRVRDPEDPHRRVGPAGCASVPLHMKSVPTGP